MAKVIAIQELGPRVVEEALDAGEDLTITRDDKPIGKVVPMIRHEDDDAFFEGSVTILGDIVEPIDAEWDATK